MVKGYLGRSVATVNPNPSIVIMGLVSCVCVGWIVTLIPSSYDGHLVGYVISVRAIYIILSTVTVCRCC